MARRTPTSKVLTDQPGGSPVQMKCDLCGQVGPTRARGGKLICAGGCSPVPQAREWTTMDVPISVVRLSPHNRPITPESVAELTESVRAIGVLEPILVRKFETNEGRHYEVIAGARRLVASQQAQRSSIPARVAVGTMDDVEADQLRLVENLQRKDLEPMEEARGFARLRVAHGHSVDQIAGEIHRSRRYVYTRLQLLELATPVQEALTAGKLDVSRALVLAQVPLGLQEEALGKILTPSWAGEDIPSVREAQARIAREYHHDLTHAPFPVADEALGSGPCGRCPRRAGAQPELFAEPSRADVCTDRACWAAKAEAYAERRKDELTAQGVEIATGQEANTVRFGAGRMELDEPCEYAGPPCPYCHVRGCTGECGEGPDEDDGGEEEAAQPAAEIPCPTWREALAAAGVQPQGLQAYEDRDGKLGEVYDREKTIAALKEKGVDWALEIPEREEPGAYERVTSRDTEREQKAKLRGSTVKAVLPFLVAEAEQRVMDGLLEPVARLLLSLRLELGHADATKALGKRRGVELRVDFNAAAIGLSTETRAWVDGLTGPEALGALLELDLAGAAGGTWADDYSPALRRACGGLGVDLKKAEKDAEKSTKGGKKAKKE